MSFHDTAMVSGAKASSSKGGSSSTGGVESSNTLFSNAKARIIELLGEGPLYEIGDEKDVFFDQTPIENADGVVNLPGVVIERRYGTPDQDPLPGFSMAESEVQVNVRVRANLGPIVRTITDPDANSVRVTVRVPSLAYQDPKTGNINGASVAWAIDVRSYGGQWREQAVIDLSGQKTTSPYQRSTPIPLPAGGSPWDLRVRRLTPDSTEAYTQNESWWDSYTIVTEGQFTYPNCALVGMTLDASLFGQNIPQRAYRVRGLIIKVPSNYDAFTRQYTGVWDGTFKNSWTNNPAWVLYDLLTNKRYGLGEFVDEQIVDKWSLYQIARHCDELIPSGLKDDLSNDILEPRYTFNGVINTRDEAYKVLQGITTSFRGMVFWSLGQVFASVDMLQDPSPFGLFTPSNVVDGVFNYSSTGKKARHSVAMVPWNDPQDFYQSAVELVQNDEALLAYGWREAQVQAIGCTSRGQAYRYGKWLLDTEQNETETVEFTTSWHGAQIRPGEIILIADPRKAQVRTGGKIAAASGTLITLDAPFVTSNGNTYKLLVVLPDGNIETRNILSFAGANVNIDSPFSQTPAPNAMWVIQGTEIAPRRFRVLEMEETESHLFKIRALFNDPTKYERIERSIQLPTIAYSRPRNTASAPTNLLASESLYRQNGVAHSRISISWTPPADFSAASYMVTADTPNGFVNFGQVVSTSLDINDAQPGPWTFYVSSVNHAGRIGPSATTSIVAENWDGAEGPTVHDLSVKGGSTTVFDGASCVLVWTNAFPSTILPYDVQNVIRIYDAATNALLHTDTSETTSYVYTFDQNVADGGPRRSFRVAVTARSIVGNESQPATITVSNPVPGAVNATLTSVVGGLFVNLPQPADNDYKGTLIWVSSTSGFLPNSTPPTVDTASTSVFVPLAAGLYYVRVAFYDEFGKTGLNYGVEQSVTVGVLGDNLEAPAIPGAPALTSTIEKRTDGSLHTHLSATWSPGTASGAAVGTYDIAVSVDGAAFLNFLTSEAAWSYDDLKPGSVVTARVRARSKNGQGISGYSPDTTITIAANTTPPGVATGLSATTAIGTVFLTWTNPTDVDFKSTEIWESTSNNRAQAVRIGQSVGGSFTRGGLTAGQTRYYWVRPVNTSSTEAAFTPASATAGLVVTTAQAQSAEIAQGAVDSTKLAANLKTITLVTSLPPVAGYAENATVSLNGVLYDLKNGVWVQTVSAANLTGQLTAAQLAANSVTFAAFDNGVTPIGIVSSLPNPVGYVGPKAVINNADGKLYRYVSGAWTTAVTGVDLTSTSFMANMVVNGDFQEGTVGASPPGWVVSSANIRIRGSAGAYSGAACLEMDRTTSAPGSNSVNVYGDRYFPVEPNKSYELNAFFKADSTTPQGVFLRALWSKADLSLTAAPGYTDAYANGGATTTWAKAGGVVVAPSDAAFVRIQIYHHSTSSARYLYVDNVSFKYTITSTLIEDDAITTPKIKAGAIVSGHMTADTIDGGVIKANSVDTKKLFADWLEAGNIRAGGIVADNLDVNSVSARNIVLTDPSNMLLNGSFYDPTKNVPSSDSWTLSATAVLHNRGAGDPLGIGAIYIPTVANENTQAAAADDIFCASGDSFHVQAVVYRGSNGLVGIYVAFLTESNALILQDWACYTNTGGFQNIKGQITAPTGCAKMSVRLVTTGRDGSNDAWGKVQVRRAANATMIVDGAVISSKIDTGAITARTLTLADTSNIILNGTFQNFASGAATTEGWTLGNGVAPQTSGPSDPGGMVRLRTSDPSTYYAATSTPDFAASEEDRFYVGLSVFNGRASGNAGAFVQFLDGNGGYLLNDAGAAGSLTYTSTKSSWTRIEGQTGSAPTGTVRARLILFGDTSASGDLYHGRIVVRRAGTAMMIVDGEIKAGKLSADSVVSSNIAAGAVKTLQLDAAAVTAKNLAVGNGLNLIYNGDFLAGKSGIAYASNIGATIEEGLATTNFGSYFHLPGMDAVYLHVTSPANPAAGGIMDFYCNRPLADGTWSQRFPVTPGQLYEASAYLSMHRCSACVRLTFWTLSDSPLTSFEGNTLTTNYANLQDPSTAPRSGVFAKAPPGAVSVSLTIRTTFTSESDPYIFMSGILLAPAQPNQTVLSPWTAGNYTVIDGESVRTGSIVTKHMQVDSLDGDRIKAGTLDVRALKANSILTGSLLVSLEGGSTQTLADIASTASGASSAAGTAQNTANSASGIANTAFNKANEDPASRINNGSTKILPGQILVAGSTTLFSLLNGADNTKIDGGSLAANTIDGNRLRIGVRGIDTLGLSFAYDKINNTLYWSTGYVTYLDKFGQYQAALIDAGARAWPSVWFSVWWKIGATSLQFTDGGKPTDPDAVTLATYWGGTLLNANYGKTVIDGSDIYTNSITANQITTGEFITVTAQIRDAIITSAKIVNLDAVKITTGTLAAERIGAASIDVTKLNVGGVSGNMIQNSDVLGGLINFIDSGGTRAIDIFGLASVNPGSVWAPTGMDAVVMHTTTGTDLGGFHDFDICNMGPTGRQTRWGCIAGQRYELSAYISSHRCSGFVFLYWFDVNGNAISANFGNSVDSYQSSGAFVNWARSGVVASAPPGAVTVELHVRQQSCTTANSDAWVMASGFFFAPATPNQTVLAPWTKGGTLSQITAQNVDAYIGAAAIGTLYLKDGVITNAKIEDATIEGAKIKNAAITNALIGDLEVSNLKLRNNTVCQGAGSAINIQDGGPYTSMVTRGTGFMLVVAVYDGVREFMSNYFTASGTSGNSTSVFTSTGYLNFYIDGVLKASKPMPDGVLSETTQLVTMPLSAGFHTFTVGITATLTRTTTTITESGGEGSAGSTTTTTSAVTKNITHGRAYLAISEFSK